MIITKINNETSLKCNNRRSILIAEVNLSQSEKRFFFYVTSSMLVLEFVEGVSLKQLAHVTSRWAGSFVCVASSRVIFSEDLPCGMPVEEDEREVFLRCQPGAL